MTKDDGTTMVNIPLQFMVAMAYDTKTYLISGGPSWVNSKGFDLDAKVLPGEASAKVKLTEEQRRSLMRALLIERFHLQAHTETKTLPVYDLVIAKDGPKIKPVAPPAPDSDDAKKRGGMSFQPGHLEAQWYPISNFAQQLGYMVERTVIDKTGLTGEYNLDLTWSPEEQEEDVNDKATTGTDPKPSIYTAIQEQLARPQQRPRRHPGHRPRRTPNSQLNGERVGHFRHKSRPLMLGQNPLTLRFGRLLAEKLPRPPFSSVLRRLV